jgi:transposase
MQLKMNSVLDAFLNLPGATVVGYQLLEEALCLHLKLLSKAINCRHCQKYTSELHQTTFILVRDLPSFGKAVYLKVPRRRFYCRNCQRYVTEFLEFLDWRQVHTRRYEQNIYQRVLSSSLEQVSREEEVSSEEIASIFRRISNLVKKKIGVQSNV